MTCRWAILLCITGLYLRWPRRGQPALAIRGRASGRLFWRDLHGTLGFLSAGVILFLAVTGMPWTEVWGGGLRAVGAANGRNPLPIVLPCHRVIGADGALVGFGGGLPTKQFRLRLEGALPQEQAALF